MKQIFAGILKVYIMSFMLLCGYVSKGQYVTLPDTAFVNWLQSNGYASCMNGNQLDTTCTTVLNATDMRCYAVPIRDLTGIQYFKGLTLLDCSNDSLYLLPPLPETITTLICQYNNLSSLPAFPPNIFGVTCGFNPLQSLPPLPQSLYSIDCDNTRLTNLPALPSGLTWLGTDNCQLTSLPSLPQTLVSLFCYKNQITTLPALPASLRTLSCMDNLLTSLPALPDSLQGLNMNNNRITTLSTVPATLIELFCDSNLLTALPVLPDSLRAFSCSSNALSADTLPRLPSTLTLLFCNHDNLTSLPSLPSGLIELDCSNNFLRAIPALPDTMSYLYCDSNPTLNCFPQINRIGALRFNGTNIACLNNYGTVVYSTPALNTLPLCDIFNPAGCNFYWSISGKCYYDADTNCTYNQANDGGISYAKILLYDGGNLLQQGFADAQGDYSFKTGYGNYSFQVDTSALPFIVACPDSNVLNTVISALDSLSYNDNFGFRCRQDGFDLGIHSIMNDYHLPIANGSFVLNVIAGDISNVYGAHCVSGIGGTVQMVYSGPINYSGPATNAITPTAVSGDTVTWNVADFGMVNDYTAFNTLFTVNGNVLEGSSACFNFTISLLQGDFNPSNNTLSYCTDIRILHSGGAPLDPNEKEVYPTTIDSGGQWLTYTIRFQNIGTAPAVNIIVADTLDSYLDPSTFQLLAYSAKNLTQLSGNIVDFNFPNINLVDSAVSDSLSRGYVQYRIKTSRIFTPIEKISNTASVYFDHNTAVVTNTVVDTVTGFISGTGRIENGIVVDIYPNPVVNQLYIKTENIHPMTTTIYDVSGSKIYTMPFKSLIDINELSGGVYFVEIASKEGMARKRFVKM